ncbi:hypothetical protein DSL72_007732 [Monilinia vaccinii-corymbosi]|uniref:Uncharacterized protein n=1 Tax=Monilinia vaccinii-corymbosi TaxID=61207 RepID=A0A8A3PIL7_9HELO|nr:hypothetical protein DSL72_007732 [Monilinia vaccinii-corymbosi]
MKTSAVFWWLFSSTLTRILIILLLTQGNTPSETSTTFAIASFNMAAFNNQHAELQVHNNVTRSDVYAIYLQMYCKGNYEEMGESRLQYTTCAGFDELARDFETMNEIWPSSILEQMSMLY